PVRAERRTTGADEAVLQPPAPRRRQLRHQAGQVVARGEAVADEQGLQRAALIPTGHANLPLGCALPKSRARELFGRRSSTARVTAGGGTRRWDTSRRRSTNRPDNR